MQTAQNLPSLLPPLAAELAKEPYYLEAGLESRSLAEISLLLETQDAPVEFTESFARFKADFCLFLLQMEAEDPLYSKKLGTLSLQNYLSATETAPAENRESDAPVSWEVEEAEPRDRKSVV